MCSAAEPESHCCGEVQLLITPLLQGENPCQQVTKCHVTCSLRSPAVYPLLRMNSPNQSSSIFKQIKVCFSSAYNLVLVVSVLLCREKTKAQFCMCLGEGPCLMPCCLQYFILLLLVSITIKEFQHQTLKERPDYSVLCYIKNFTRSPERSLAGFASRTRAGGRAGLPGSFPESVLKGL